MRSHRTHAAPGRSQALRAETRLAFQGACFRVNSTQKWKLRQPLLEENVLTRKGMGTTLSYIEGWWAIAEANRIFGFDGWDRDTMEMTQLGESYKYAKDGKDICLLGDTDPSARVCGSALPPYPASWYVAQ